MEHIKYSLSLFAYFSCLLTLAFAQDEQVLSTFIYVHHGERTPMLWIDDPSLTPYGARQLEQAGINMRNRYVESTAFGDETSYTVRGISSIFLKNKQINILTSTDEWVTASAQAFMQGLFPPLTHGQNDTVIEGESRLVNGTNVVAPLGGYQYPNIQSASSYDLNSIFVKGTDNCDRYGDDMELYWQSSTYKSAEQMSQSFYDSLKQPLLNGVFTDSSVGYHDAYYIWDYLNYGYLHNDSIALRLSKDDLLRAQLLAGNWMLDMYANTTDGKVGQAHIRAIAGRSLAYYIMSTLMNSIRQKGDEGKINLVFGDYIPMMSFAALAGLMQERTGDFFYAPKPGASMIFELYTTKPQSASLPYPSTTDMSVRFYYKNDTNPDIEPQMYSLFGRSPSLSTMNWGEFVSAMSGIQLTSVQDWCQSCGSSAVFCSNATQGGTSGSNNHHGLQPAVAGVVGAVAALAFMAFVITLAMLLGGLRVHKRSKQTSQLGGFKGNEKLASDQDLTVPKGSAGVTVHEEPRGHERVGSWELKEPVNIQDMHPGIDTARFRQPTHGLDHDDTVVDPYAIPVKPRDAF